jgi:hypothetical protein
LRANANSAKRVIVGASRTIAGPLAFALGASVLLATACGGPNRQFGSTGGMGTTGTTGTTASGTGGMGGAGGTGNTGGSSVIQGKPATDLVSAGRVSKSTNYKLVSTTGQATPNRTKATSPGYRMQAGLVGAMGTLP